MEAHSTSSKQHKFTMLLTHVPPLVMSKHSVTNFTHSNTLRVWCHPVHPVGSEPTLPSPLKGQNPRNTFVSSSDCSNIAGPRSDYGWAEKLR